VSEVSAPAVGGDLAGDAVASQTPAEGPGAADTTALGVRNSRLLLGGVIAYAVVVSGLMIVRGVAVTPDVLLVAFGLVAILLGRGRLFLRDWVPFIALFLAYELMRGLADKFGFAVHVSDVLAVERLLAFGHVPTQVLQDWLHPASGVDVLAVAATVVYFLHFPLPLGIGFLLWLKRRAAYYDFVAALILLCLAGFVTFVFLPVGPPWYAAYNGYFNGPDGRPAITYLKPEAFDQIASALGFNGRYLYSYAFYQVSPNSVAAFPSLHAAFPFLAFLFARRAFGRIGWLVFGYFLIVVFAIVYLGDHYVVDALAGVAYASAAYVAVVHGPERLRTLLTRLRDDGLEGRAAVLDPVPSGSAAVARGAVNRRGIAIALLAACAGAGGMVALTLSHQQGTPLYLVPAALVLGGLWRASALIVRR
jgi:hypothetical protein